MLLVNSITLTILRSILLRFNILSLLCSITSGFMPLSHVLCFCMSFKMVASFLPRDSYASYSSTQEMLRSLLHSVIKV